MEQNYLARDCDNNNSSIYGLNKLIYVGSESRIYKCTFLRQTAIAKVRRKKAYMEDKLWEKLSLSRTRKELKLLIKLKTLEVLTPKVYFYDFNNNTIIMEYIEGSLLYNTNSVKLYQDAGLLLHKLHTHRIWHGDFHPKNLIVKNSNLYVIDFGLSKTDARNEELAYDLLTFAKADVSQKLIDVFLSTYKKYNQIVYNAYKKISSLGRYK
ncbi:MAG: KEOPS complex kinase/ATPase Bud32 [Candidatus Micrarchaeota archaeon]|nr:KEOPS complex kinase/ATPase Bud32 [Candidatus Micrarchaeota archaeon]